MLYTRNFIFFIGLILIFNTIIKDIIFFSTNKNKIKELNEELTFNEKQTKSSIKFGGEKKKIKVKNTLVLQREFDQGSRKKKKILYSTAILSATFIYVLFHEMARKQYSSSPEYEELALTLTTPASLVVNYSTDIDYADQIKSRYKNLNERCISDSSGFISTLINNWNADYTLKMQSLLTNNIEYEKHLSKYLKMNDWNGKREDLYFQIENNNKKYKIPVFAKFDIKKDFEDGKLKPNTNLFPILDEQNNIVQEINMDMGKKGNFKVTAQHLSNQILIQRYILINNKINNNDIAANEIFRLQSALIIKYTTNNPKNNIYKVGEITHPHLLSFWQKLKKTMYRQKNVFQSMFTGRYFRYK